MAKKQSGWKTKGMNRDLSVSAFNSEFAFENRNLRLSTNEGNTLLSWVNEKGTEAITLSSNVFGHVLGTAVLNNYLVLFTRDNSVSALDAGYPDYIYRLNYNSARTQMTVVTLYNGNLGFDLSRPIETMVSYEAEDIQKVYWTDNNKQPRLINIAPGIIIRNKNNGGDTQFDFVPTLQLNEKVYVEKILGASGSFAPGVIQYALTYYNKYGQESNVFYTTPLHYISYKDRGASPEDRVENAFRITIDNLDEHFDYLRIYSIQRTSINGTPIVKRIQDIGLRGLENNTTVSYLDTGTTGDSIDPTELLYKGGEPIKALTMEQKDNTLFFGNFEVTKQRPIILNSVAAALSITEGFREFTPKAVSTDNYSYANQLTSIDEGIVNGNKLFGQPSGVNADVPCGGFKYGQNYRLGVQFQDTFGRWSEPVFKGADIPCGNHPTTVTLNNTNKIKVPVFVGTLSSSISSNLIAAGYVRARAVVVFPGLQDRDVLCQGVVCPTMYTVNHRGDESTPALYDKDIYAQSSWFFRGLKAGNNTNADYVNSVGAVYPEPGVAPAAGGTFISRNIPYVNWRTYFRWWDHEENTYRTKKCPADLSTNEYGNPVDAKIRRVEIEGGFKLENEFRVDYKFLTFHSPDIEFDAQMSAESYTGVSAQQVGFATFLKTLSDISLQTETPTSSANGAGFIHKSFVNTSMFGIVSGLFYEDYVIDDNDDSLEAYDREKSPVKWLVYPWNANGSLNNDINRPADKGTATSILKKKTISNLRYAGDTDYTIHEANPEIITPELFNSNEASFIKVDGKIYQGNVDTVLTPDYMDGKYFAFGNNPEETPDPNYYPLTVSQIETPFASEAWWKTYAVYEGGDEGSNYGLLKYYVRHNQTPPKDDLWERKDDQNIGNIYTGLVLKKGSVRMKYKSTPHLVFQKAAPYSFNNVNGLNVVDIKSNSVPNRYGGTTKDALKENTWVPCGEPVALNSTGATTFYYTYGDTYYQRWDCLKTYAFTPEDINQVVEIGSFMIETRVNIDGRYDRNRGQLSNINMSPVNFNLMNPVYSQINNFFSYKILDEDTYTNTWFPNQITWTKTHQAGADVDLWTNITLASTLEMDGDKGQINKITRFDNQLIALQDTGTAVIQYNENVIISSKDGVPIEIANSDKIRGKKYISENIGCSDKWSVVRTPSGVYFMDSHNKAVFVFNGQLNNLSGLYGFNTWAKKSIPAPNVIWTPNNFSNFVSYYDKLNQDVLFINSAEALAYSERVGAFTSFYDYGHTPYFCNIDNTGIWVKPYYNETTQKWYTGLWKHNAGNYCNFFGINKPYSMILVGNPEPQMDKIFTNLEFRACVDGEYSSTPATPLLPFNSLETWDEYQHGIANIDTRSGHSAFKHHTTDNNASLKRKFRIWRCDIPRDNADLSTDTVIGITRAAKHPLDRMRNPWLYLKLMKNAQANMPRAEIHDIVMTYFD